MTHEILYGRYNRRSLLTNLCLTLLTPIWLQGVPWRSVNLEISESEGWRKVKKSRSREIWDSSSNSTSTSADILSSKIVLGNNSYRMNVHAVLCRNLSFSPSVEMWCLRGLRCKITGEGGIMIIYLSEQVTTNTQEKEMQLDIMGLKIVLCSYII